MPSYGKFKDFTALQLALTAVWERDLILNSQVASLYNIRSSARAVERTQELSNFGLVPEYNGTLEYNEVVPGDRKEFLHKEYAQAITIPRKFLDDDEYSVVESMVSRYATAFSRTVTYHMSSTFNEAFSTTNYVVSDGRALCSTSRTTGKAVLNNKGTSALTHDNVVETRNLMRQFKDRSGLVLTVNPDTIIVPVQLEAVAYEIVASERRSDNANNAANANRPVGWNVIVDPLLTDNNNWFMVDSTLARQHLWWWWRVQPEFVIDPKSAFDLALRSRGYMRYSFGADDFVWIYGHEVA